MPQTKYDLRNHFEKSARRYSNEEERLTQLQTVIDAHHKQAQMPKKYKLPTFDCPACHAKNIMFAGDAVAKNKTILTLLEENGVADYVIICPKMQTIHRCSASCRNKGHSPLLPYHRRNSV